MARTTIDIDDPVLRDLKRLQKKRGQPLGRLVSELLATALAEEQKGPAKPRAFRWRPRSMGEARVDLRDKDAVWAILEADESSGADR